MTIRTGWYLLTFLSELEQGVSPLEIGDRALIAVRSGDDVRVYDGVCPHRGAHLGYGGVMRGECVVCPFHGKSVHLGGSGRLSVDQHYVVRAGDAVFLRVGNDPQSDRGFEQAIKQAATTHTFVAGTVCTADVAAEYIVENAFDVDHFTAVHNVPRITGMDVSTGDCGELCIDGEFRTAVSPWGSDAEFAAARRRVVEAGAMDYSSTSRFYARAYSPHVVLTELGDASVSSVVVTGAVPLRDGRCQARVVIGLQPSQERALPALVAGAKKAMAEDLVIWDHLDVTAPPQYDARDEPVLAYRRFAAEFGDLTAG